MLIKTLFPNKFAAEIFDAIEDQVDAIEVRSDFMSIQHLPTIRENMAALVAEIKDTEVVFEVDVWKAQDMLNTRWVVEDVVTFTSLIDAQDYRDYVDGFAGFTALVYTSTVTSEEFEALLQEGI